MRNTGKRVNVRSPIRQTLDTEMTAKASSRAGELILLGERLKGGGAIVAAFEKARPPPLLPANDDQCRPTLWLCRFLFDSPQLLHTTSITPAHSLDLQPKSIHCVLTTGRVALYTRFPLFHHHTTTQHGAHQENICSG